MMNPDSNITSEPSAKKKREGPFRGPSRALKYKKLRQAQPGKVKVEIPSSLGAAVGDHALQFVGECSDWVKDFCPLNVYKWSDMLENILDELYGKIKSKFDVGEGAHIEKALKMQCSSLYRHWRERLKKKKFSKCKSLKEAERACPEDINIDQWKWLVYTYWNDHKTRERSEKNRANAYSKKTQSACGAKSTARIIHEMAKGVDNLSIDEVYMKVLGHCSGYAQGLGKGHPIVDKGGKKGKAVLQAEIQQLKGVNDAMRAEWSF